MLAQHYGDRREGKINQDRTKTPSSVLVPIMPLQPALNHVVWFFKSMKLRLDQ